jgi:hypothetical protein
MGILDALGERQARSFASRTEEENQNPNYRSVMETWDDKQWGRYRDAMADNLQNEIRLGLTSPDEANQRLARVGFSLNGASSSSNNGNSSSSNFDSIGSSASTASRPSNGLISPSGVTNSGQLQQGAMTAADLPDATSQLGDTNGLGMDNAYWSQLRNAAQAQEGITQDVGDMQLSREFDRTARYRLPLENYRMDRDFAYGQKAEQNTSKRQRANDLMTTYAQTAQSLITSGL